MSVTMLTTIACIASVAGVVVLTALIGLLYYLFGSKDVGDGQPVEGDRTGVKVDPTAAITLPLIRWRGDRPMWV